MIKRTFYLLTIALNTNLMAMDSVDTQTSTIQQEHEDYDTTYLASFGKSYPIGLLNKHFQSKMRNKILEIMKVGNADASKEFQDLGEEAQYMVGIPEESHVPIKKIDPASPLAKIVGAIAEPNAIYVGEEKLNERAYGCKRCALFHEAIHNKYNDLSTDSVLGLITFVGTSVFAYKAVKLLKLLENRPTLCLAASIIGCFASGFVSLKFHKYIERRADIEGHYATQCYVCVKESSDQRKKSFEQDNNPLKNNGYLWSADLEKISQDLKNENNICLFHHGKTEPI